MENNKLLNETDIGDIILCDPITSRGTEALGNLGITITEISPDYFYKEIRIPSKYDGTFSAINDSVESFSDQNYLYYQYTSNKKQIETIQKQLQTFNSRFISDSENGYPILIFGVAGNGKSIEINRRIREFTNGDSSFECGKTYFDLESAFTEITYGETYECLDENSALWLLSIKILDGLMQYIINNAQLSQTIFKNFNNILVKHNIVNNQQKEIFINIGNYSLDDKISETVLFSSITKTLDLKNPESNIKSLLYLLMLIMYCSDPKRKHFIVIDNIEQYIHLSSSKTQIYNSDISIINKIINTVIANIAIAFNRIERNLSWRAFKIVIVLRRTSLGFLDPVLLQTPIKGYENRADFTGHFQVSDIWEKKKKHIWESILCKRFSNDENNKIITLIDLIMKDGIDAIGTDYQSLIAPLMSYGIRRNARSQAHAVSEIYELLMDGNRGAIGYDSFIELISSASYDNSTVRYMLRRALIEIQFKWSISEGNKDRWKQLNIGHLSGEKDIYFGNKKLKVETVSFDNSTCITLFRRVLAFLSSFPEQNTFNDANDKSITDMFSTISIYDLVEGVLLDPSHKNKISEEQYLQLSKVLLALSNMSYFETKSAPYIILGIKDSRFNQNTTPLQLARIIIDEMEKVNSGIKSKSDYDLVDFGVRITDAGYSFMLDWLSSFSFISSLYCFTVPPLFFLKDVSSIKYVIKTVYDASLALCQKYENEAKRFCGNNNTLKKGNYLPKHRDKYVTFKERVKELHVQHLLLYRNYLQSNHQLLQISNKDLQYLTRDNYGYISEYILKYNRWATGKGASECF